MDLNKKIKDLKESSFGKIVMEYSRFLVIALYSVYLIFLFSIYTKRSNEYMYKPFVISVLIIIPILLLGFIYLNADNFTINYTLFIVLCIMGVIALITSLVYFYISQQKDTAKAKSNSVWYFSSFIIFLIVLVGITLYYNIFTDAVKKQKGWYGFFINLLFYLPCLITDYFHYLFNEVNNTPSIVFILFVVEICLLLLYLYLPSIVNAIFIPKGLSLLSKPVFLNPSNIITGSSTFLVDSPVSIEVDEPLKTYNSNFSLSMWIFINNTILGTTQQESIIFKYGRPTDDFYGKPCITYLGNDNWRFMFTNNHGYSSKTDLTLVPLPEYIIKMPSQVWHNVVFSYYENRVDLYINGSLVRSMELKDKLPIKYDDDVVTIGSKSPLNIPGSICNINYYQTPLTSSQVSRIYNMLFMFNPPVNNLQ